jgi:HEAT repeat protein
MNARQHSTNLILRVLAGAVAIVLIGPTLLHGAEAKPDLAGLVNSMPDCDKDGKYTGPAPDVALKAVQEVLKGGKDNLVALVGMLKEPDPPSRGDVAASAESAKGEDYKARYLLHAVATHVRRPDAEQERRMVSEALASTLDGARPSIIKAYVLEELEWVGGPESVAAVSKLLLDPELYDFAIRALVNIRAAAPMRAALPGAKGRNRVALTQALGVLRAAKSVPAVTQALRDADRDLRLAAAHALANSGDPAAVEPLLKAAATEAPYERSQLINSLLLLARRLGEAGDKKAAERICRHLLKTRTGPGDVHVRCAALLALAEALGADAMDDVLAAMGSEEPDIRATAIEAAIAMPGEKATEHWVERLKKAEPAGKIGILDLLARRGDPAALPAVLAAMKAPEEKVRAAAIKTAGMVGNEQAVAPLAAALTGASPIERAAARNALLRIPGKPATAAIAKALGPASPDVRVTLIDILAARKGKEHLGAIVSHTRDENAKVSTAAVAALGNLADTKDLPVLTRLLVDAEKGAARAAAERALASACGRLGDKRKCVAAVADALEGTKGPARASLLRVLGEIGTRTALLVVRAGLDEDNADVQDAALRALTDWRDDAPANDLLAIARKSKNQTHQVLALRGYVQMIGLRKNRPVDESLQMCRKAMGAARRNEEKRLALAAIGSVPDPKALKAAEAHFADQALKDEAAIAVIRIARAISAFHRAEAKAAAKRAMAATDNKEVRKQAESAIYAIERLEDFITAWMVAGPYPGGIGNKKHFPPEKPDAKDVKWKLISATGRQPGVVDLHREVTRRGQVTAYLRCEIWSSKDQAARLEVGTDDGVKVWLNGKLIHDKDVPRSLKINEDKLPVKFNEGWNKLLVRVTQGGGGWEACVRVRAADGKKLPGLRLKAE